MRPHQNNFPTRGQVPNIYFEIILVEPIVALPFCGVKNVCPLSNGTAEASVAILITPALVTPPSPLTIIKHNYFNGAWHTFDSSTWPRNTWKKIHEPPPNVFPQGFPRMILFQTHFDPLSHNYFAGSATCQASTPSVLHPPFHSNSMFQTCFEVWGTPSENAPSICIRNPRITEGYPYQKNLATKGNA